MTKAREIAIMQDKIKQQHPDWDFEKILQEARKVVNQD